MLEETAKALNDLIRKGSAVVPVECEIYIDFILKGEQVDFVKSEIPADSDNLYYEIW